MLANESVPLAPQGDGVDKYADLVNPNVEHVGSVEGSAVRQPVDTSKTGVGRPFEYIPPPTTEQAKRAQQILGSDPDEMLRGYSQVEIQNRDNPDRSPHSKI